VAVMPSAMLGSPMLRSLVMLFITLASVQAQAEVIRFAAGDQSLQAVIERAQAGDTVELPPGRYPGPLELKQGVTLRGAAADPKQVVLDGGGKAPVIRLAKGSTLAAVSVTGGGRFDQKTFDRHHESRGEHLADNEGAAGFVAGAVELDRAELRGCRVHDNGGPGISVAGEGNTSRVVSNVVFRNMGGGIGIADGATAFVAGNRCSENLRAGIGCRASAPQLIDNVCHDNVRAGIGIREGARPLVRGNECFGNRRAGIGVRMAGTSPLLLDNYCHGNGMAGIGSRDASAPVLSGNLCVSNRLAGIGAMSDVHLVAIDNTLRANGAAAFGLAACDSGRAYLEGNTILAKDLVAMGVQSGWSVFARSNRVERVGGMPPLVMVFADATADFRGNEFRGSGIAAIRCVGEVFVASNHFIRPEPGPERNAVWGLDGSVVRWGAANRVRGWKMAKEAVAAPDPDAWEKMGKAARTRIRQHD